MSNSRHHLTLPAALGLLVAALLVPTAAAAQGVIAGTVARSGTWTPAAEAAARLRQGDPRRIPDPRVPVVDAGVVGHDRVTRIWRTTRYPTAASPIPIASYDEARLIVAEIDAGTGTPTGIASAVSIINDLDARAGIPLYGGGTAAEVQAQVRESGAGSCSSRGNGSTTSSAST